MRRVDAPLAGVPFDAPLAGFASGRLGMLLLVSGATGLAYEVLWARDFALLYGATAVGAAVVLAATFAGLALGAWASGRVVAGADARFGLRLYALLEIGLAVAIAAYVGARPALSAAGAALARSVPEPWLPLAELALAAAVLLLPAALLGATLPAAVAALPPGDGPGAARVYAWNALGGAFGAVAAVALALPWLGTRGTWLACAALDVAVGGAALVLARALAAPGGPARGRASGAFAPIEPQERAAPAQSTARTRSGGSYRAGAPAEAVAPAVPRPLRRPRAVSGSPEAGERPRPHRALALAATAATGFVGLACEVLWVRGLSGVLSNSVYSFALVLAAVLLGIVAGAAVAAARLRRPHASARARAALSLAASALALGIVASGVALHRVPELGLALARAIGVHSAASGLAVEGLLCVAVILPAAVALGALFPFALVLAEPHAPPRGMGAVLAANTAGAVLGSLVAAFVLLPRLGLGGGLLATAALAAGIALAAAGRTRVVGAALAASAVVLAAAPLAPRLALRWRETGGAGATAEERVVFWRDGAAATVAVTADARGRKRLRVNGQYSLGGTAGLLLERRQAHLPLLLHPEPHTALFIGVGTGDTLGAAVAHPDVRVDGIELLPEVLEAAELFATENRGALEHPRVRVHVADARTHLLYSRDRWDVIVSDLFLPWTAGTAHLYARELYRAGRSHLEPGGLFAQWLPLHQLAVADLEAIVATFLDVFPHARLWVAYHRSDTPLGLLVGSAVPLRMDADARRARVAAGEVGRALRSAGFLDAGDVAPLYVADTAQLAAAARSAPVLTDDRPLLEFSAPAAYFRQGELAGESLEWLLARIDPGDAPVDGAPPASAALRRTLLEAQLALVRGDRPGELERYGRALALSPGTRAVRQALHGIARERLAAGDVATARAIATALGRAAPASEEARRSAELVAAAPPTARAGRAPGSD